MGNMHTGWAEASLVKHQRNVDAMEEAADHFDRASKNAAAELAANIERVLSSPDWMASNVTAGEYRNRKEFEVEQSAIDAFIEAMDADTVAPVLAALVASPAGAELRKAIAQFHASVNADIVAIARGL
jgi:hypothetical protein